MAHRVCAARRALLAAHLALIFTHRSIAWPGIANQRGGVMPLLRTRESVSVKANEKIRK